MSKAFSRSMRSMSSDNSWGPIYVLLIIAILLCAGIAWSFLARVSLYEISETARLELYQAINPLEAAASGQATAIHITLGQEVQPGDVLVELDARTERLKLREEQTRLAGLSRQLDALRDEISVQEKARLEARKTASIDLEKARIEVRAAVAVARFAVEETERLKRLHEGGNLSEVSLRQIKSEAQGRRATAEALRLTIARLEKEQQTAPLSVDKAQARYREAEAGVKFSQENLKRLADLYQKGALAEVDFQRSKAELQKQQEAAEALRIEASKLEKEQQAAPIALEEARSRYREAEAIAQFSEAEVERLTRLYAEMHPDQAIIRNAELEAQKQQANADSLDFEIRRLEQEQQTQDTDRKAQIMKLMGEVNQIEGEIPAVSAKIDGLKHEIEKRLIRAPVGGKLGEVEALRTGSFIREGDRLGAIVSSGEIKAMAYFTPSSAFGRIQPGQTARMIFHGFPRAQYGTVSAVVTRVANEPRDGKVQVELDLKPHYGCRIPLQHGLPGTVEVEVDRVSPATLVLRSIGKLLFEKPIARE